MMRRWPGGEGGEGQNAVTVARNGVVVMVVVEAEREVRGKMLELSQDMGRGGEGEGGRVRSEVGRGG